MREQRDEIAKPPVRKAVWRVAILAEGRDGAMGDRLLVGLSHARNIRARLEHWDPETPRALRADAVIVPAMDAPDRAIRCMRLLTEQRPKLPIIGIFAFYDARHAIEAGIVTRGRAHAIFWDGTPDERLAGEVLSVLESRPSRGTATGTRPLLLEALSLSPVALCLTTLDDEIVEVNDSFSDLIGRPETELVGQPLAEIVPRRRDDTLAAVLEEIDTADTLIGRARLKMWSAAVSRMPGLPATAALADGTLAPGDLPNLEANDLVMLSRDAVTGLTNRQTFLAQLARRVVDARPDEAFALLCIDLDRFTEVNDSLGHPIGDRVLKVVADRLRRRLRALDGVARLGGDEFAVLLGGLAAGDDLQAIAQRLSRAVEQRIIIGSHEIHLGCSIGIAQYPVDATDAMALLRRADLALNDAKRSGRGTERMFDPSQEARIQTRRQTESELYRGIERKEFVLHYQPIVELPSRRIVGVEALVRWNHPERGLIMPGDFIPLAESTGSIRALGAWVLHEACRAVASWRAHRLPRLWLAVNISAAQFRSGDLVNLVDFALTSSGLTASELELEITETAVLEAGRLDTVNQLAQLNELGVTISVDDFGTGYGSMVYLRNFPVTKIKIDGSFVKAAPDHPKEAAIVRAICGLGRDLHMRILAEAVETEAQFSFVQQTGCTEAQGFLFARPLPEAALVGLLENLPAASGDGAVTTRSDWVFPSGSPAQSEE